MPFATDRQRRAFFAQRNNPNSSNNPIIIKTNSKTNAQKRGVIVLDPLDIKSNRLPVQVGIAVPSTELDKKISDKNFKKRINDEKKFFSKTFGGDTSIKATGSFVLKKGKKDILIKEKISLVESSMTPVKYKQSRKILSNHIIKMKTNWKQNSVLYKVEGENYIYPRQSFIDHDKSSRKIIIS